MRLIFIRHGDPYYPTDTLTERGWKEAELLSQRVIKWDVDTFYCSPLGRARDTASVSLKKLERNAIVYDWLREFHAPVLDPISGQERIPWDFMPSYWTKKPELYDKDNWHKSDVMMTGDVTNEYIRVCQGLDGILAENGYERKDGYYLAKNPNKKTLVFFCHLGVQFVMLSHLLGISAPNLWQGFFVAPSSVTELVTEERIEGEACFRCKRLGDVSHLYIGDVKPSNSGFFSEVYSDNI